MLKIKDIKGDKYKFSGVYGIRNIITDKWYVGQAQDVAHRFKKYCTSRFMPKLQNSIKRHGIENFEVVILAKDVNVNFLDIVEQHYIDLYDVVKNGYNICPISGNSRGVKCTAETKAKISKANKGKKHTINGRKNISKGRKKFFQENPEACKKNSEIRKKFFQENPEARKKAAESQRKPVVQINKYFYVVNVFASAQEAGKSTSIHCGSISECCNGRYKTAGGFKWRFA